MFQNKVLGRTGGILNKAPKKADNIPKQYTFNISEASNDGVSRGLSASAAPIIAVDKRKFANKTKKFYKDVKSNDNLTYFLDFRDSLKVVSGGAEGLVGGVKEVSKPVPTHSKPFYKSMPLFIQACIDCNYGKDNILYDNTSKTRKFSTPANGRFVPERNDLFGILLDDLNRVSQGQFPIHEEWFDSFGADFTPSRAQELLSILARVSRLVNFTKETNTWIGKGSYHLTSIMNALLIKNLVDPRTYQKQKYYSHLYHISEQSYDDYQGRAIRGEPKPLPLKNATLPPLPFPSPYVQDILLGHRQEAEAARQDSMRQADMARRIASAAWIQLAHDELPFPFGDSYDAPILSSVPIFGPVGANQNTMISSVGRIPPPPPPSRRVPTIEQQRRGIYVGFENRPGQQPNRSDVSVGTDPPQQIVGTDVPHQIVDQALLATDTQSRFRSISQIIGSIRRQARRAMDATQRGAAAAATPVRNAAISMISPGGILATPYRIAQERMGRTNPQTQRRLQFDAENPMQPVTDLDESTPPILTPSRVMPRMVERVVNAITPVRYIRAPINLADNLVRSTNWMINNEDIPVAIIQERKNMRDHLRLIDDLENNDLGLNTRFGRRLTPDARAQTIEFLNQRLRLGLDSAPRAMNNLQQARRLIMEEYNRRITEIERNPDLANIYRVNVPPR